MLGWSENIKKFKKSQVSYQKVGGSAGFIEKKNIEYTMIKEEPMVRIPSYLDKKK